ncbi:MAG: CDP-alcohol phosphatidyltransferase family protein, partial [Rhizobiaceae bacterium]
MKDRPEQSAKTFERLQKNLLVASERRLLTWLCGRMPAWVTPDILTSGGLLGGVAVFAGYVASQIHSGWLWLAIAGYVLNWFGDSMDGSLARFRKIERPSFGYFVDHSVDGVAASLILGGLGLSPFVRLDVALLCLVGYLLLMVHTFLSARVLGELRLSHLGGGPTELRLILIGLTLAMFLLGAGPGLFAGLSGFDMFVGSVGILFITLFGVQTIRIARQIAIAN